MNSNRSKDCAMIRRVNMLNVQIDIPIKIELCSIKQGLKNVGLSQLNKLEIDKLLL